MSMINRLTFVILFFLLSFDQIYGQEMYLDSAFGTNGRAKFYYNGRYDETLDMAIQNDGKIILVGDATYETASLKWKVGRLNTDGTIDTTFNIPTTYPEYGWATTLKIQPDSKILVAGHTGFNNIILRYNNTGSIDSTFNDSGYVSINPEAVKIFLVNNDKIIVVGNVGYGQTEIIRLNSDGTIDSTYGVNGVYVLDAFYTTSASMQSNRCIILTGGDYSLGGSQLRGIDLTGIPNAFFGTNGIVNDPQVLYSILQPDDKIISVCRGEDTIFHTGFTIMRRFNADGSFDATFNMVDSSSITNYVDGLVLPNSKFLFAIQKFSLDSIGFIQLNSDGSIDSAFPTNNINLLDYSSTNKISIQADGKILVSEVGVLGVKRFIRDFTSSISNPELSINNYFVFQGNGYIGIQMREEMKTQIIRITISDLYGKTIKEIPFENIPKNQNRFFFPIENSHASGIYFISLFTADKRKLVKRIFIN